jgi:hypothetical protein
MVQPHITSGQNGDGKKEFTFRPIVFGKPSQLGSHQVLICGRKNPFYTPMYCRRICLCSNSSWASDAPVFGYLVSVSTVPKKIHTRSVLVFTRNPHTPSNWVYKTYWNIWESYRGAFFHLSCPLYPVGPLTLFLSYFCSLHYLLPFLSVQFFPGFWNSNFYAVIYQVYGTTT